jgi:hypothetical protein
MIISIDRSPLWMAQRGGTQQLSRLLEALFRSRRWQGPVEQLEVLVLAHALECSEATIEQYSAAFCESRLAAREGGTASSPRPRTGSARLLRMTPRIPPPYSPTSPD